MTSRNYTANDYYNADCDFCDLDIQQQNLVRDKMLSRRFHEGITNADGVDVNGIRPRYTIHDYYHLRCSFLDLSSEQKLFVMDQLSNAIVEFEGEQPNIIDDDKWFTNVSHEIDCSVCLDQGNECVSLRCGHSFHKMCITTWLKTSLTCPVCRSNVYL